MILIQRRWWKWFKRLKWCRGLSSLPVKKSCCQTLMYSSGWWWWWWWWWLQAVVVYWPWQRPCFQSVTCLQWAVHSLHTQALIQRKNSGYLMKRVNNQRARLQSAGHFCKTTKCLLGLFSSAPDVISCSVDAMSRFCKISKLWLLAISFIKKTVCVSVSWASHCIHHSPDTL